MAIWIGTAQSDELNQKFEQFLSRIHIRLYSFQTISKQLQTVPGVLRVKGQELQTDLERILFFPPHGEPGFL